MAYIPDNTFAAACYDQNSVEELEQALCMGPDKQDMKTWRLTAQEWRDEIELALKALREEGVSYARQVKETS